MPVRVTAVTVGTTTVNRVTPGRRITGVDVLLPADPMTLPKAGGYTYFMYLPSATWAFQHPLGRVPQVALYDLDGQQMDTDIEATTTTVTLTFATPMSGYVILT